MGILFLERYTELEGDRVYACRECCSGENQKWNLFGDYESMSNIVHIASPTDIISKGFHSTNGPAYLFDTAINVTCGESTEREMTSGTHVVKDVFCIRCHSLIGWKYLKAYNITEEYKVGKLCLERNSLVGILSSSGTQSPGFSALERSVVIFPRRDVREENYTRRSFSNPHTTLRQSILEGSV